MNKIEMNKQYRTRNGKEVRVLCVDRNDSLYPVVVITQHNSGGNSVDTYTRDGRYLGPASGPSASDLIEVSPYEHIKIDDPVVVTAYPNGTSSPVIRHFAGVDDQGNPLTWTNGCTSYTTASTTNWASCVKFDPAIHSTVQKGD